MFCVFAFISQRLDRVNMSGRWPCHTTLFFLLQTYLALSVATVLVTSEYPVRPDLEKGHIGHTKSSLGTHKQ
jgi:hypothetical protein